VISVFAEIV